MLYESSVANWRRFNSLKKITIIPKQAAGLGGMVELVEKENEGLKLDAAQIAALEKEFMETFETFTVIVSLSKK